MAELTIQERLRRHADLVYDYHVQELARAGADRIDALEWALKRTLYALVDRDDNRAVVVDGWALLGEES